MWEGGCIHVWVGVHDVVYGCWCVGVGVHVGVYVLVCVWAGVGVCMWVCIHVHVFVCMCMCDLFELCVSPHTCHCQAGTCQRLWWMTYQTDLRLIPVSGFRPMPQRPRAPWRRVL